MIRSSRGGMLPRRILIAVAAALVPLIAGCEAGTNAPSLHWHQPTDGTGQRSARTSRSATPSCSARRSASAEARPERRPVPRPGEHRHAGPAAGVKAPGVAQSVLLPGGGIPAPHSTQRPADRPGAGDRAAAPGQAAHRRLGRQLNLTSRTRGDLLVPVMPRAQYYTTLSPAPATSPSASASPAGKPRIADAVAAAPSPRPAARQLRLA